MGQEKTKKQKKQKKEPVEQVTVQKAPLANQIDTVSYSLGIVLGTSIKNAGITSINDEAFVKGLEDAINAREPVLSIQQANMFLDSYVSKLAEQKGRENLEKGNQFLAANAKKDSVVTLPSGLQYKIIKEGSGQPPVDTSFVTVHYTGRLIDGTVFDSSRERGEPASFPVNGVIPGWVEALKLMKPGARWMLYIPPHLAYGEQGMRTILPNSVLIFDVELLSVGEKGN
jgi:FKBP-type peptidyl-prolyl cis-trans isomerase FklB